MKIANLYKDIDILKLVQQASIDLYRRDPDLLLKENAQLRQKISEIFESDGDKICL
jgi:ATP-dependent DNA helicase RecG